MSIFKPKPIKIASKKKGAHLNSIQTAFIFFLLQFPGCSGSLRPHAAVARLLRLLSQICKHSSYAQLICNRRLGPSRWLWQLLKSAAALERSLGLYLA